MNSCIVSQPQLVDGASSLSFWGHTKEHTVPYHSLPTKVTEILSFSARNMVWSFWYMCQILQHVYHFWMLFIKKKLDLTKQTSWKQIYEKLIVPWVIKQFPAFYGSQRLIIIFTWAHHLSLSWARWIQSICSHSNFIKVSFNIFSGMYVWVFLAAFLSVYVIKILLAYLVYLIQACMLCPYHPS